MKRIFTIALMGFFVSVSMVSYGQWTVTGSKTYYKVTGGSVGIGTDTPCRSASARRPVARTRDLCLRAVERRAPTP